MGKTEISTVKVKDYKALCQLLEMCKYNKYVSTYIPGTVLRIGGLKQISFHGPNFFLNFVLLDNKKYT